MKKILAILLAVLIFTPSAESAPRTHGVTGTATTTNSSVTFPFHPTQVCIINRSATEPLYYDWTDGVATTASGSSNHYVAISSQQCWEFSPNTSPTDTFSVGLITAATTALYAINGTRHN